MKSNKFLKFFIFLIGINNINIVWQKFKAPNARNFFTLLFFLKQTSSTQIRKIDIKCENLVDHLYSLNQLQTKCDMHKKLDGNVYFKERANESIAKKKSSAVCCPIGPKSCYIHANVWDRFRLIVMFVFQLVYFSSIHWKTRNKIQYISYIYISHSCSFQ